MMRVRGQARRWRRMRDSRAGRRRPGLLLEPAAPIADSSASLLRSGGECQCC